MEVIVEKNKNIVLFSGGIDSLATYCLLRLMGESVSLLYVDLGTKYSVKERNVAQDLVGKINALDNFYSFGKFYDLPLHWIGLFEQEDAEIKNRNLLLLTIASFFGKDIFISLENGSQINPSEDRSDDFLHSAEGLIKIKIYNLVRCFTKGEEVGVILEYFKDKALDILKSTYSCYAGGNERCGECPACVRTFFALKFNNINTEGWFVVNPLLTEIGQTYIKRIRQGYYTGRRGEEYTKVLDNLYKEDLL